MFEFHLFGVRCRLSLLFPLLLTALLLWQPQGVAVTCLLASLMHEMGHLLAMWALGLPPEECVLGAFGMRMELGNPLAGYGKNLLISVAGPAVNLLASVLFWRLGAGQTAVVHGVLAVLNLLPSAALDGGEILRCGLCLLGAERWAMTGVRIASVLVVVPLSIYGFWLWRWQGGNGTLLVVSGYLMALLFFSNKNEKSS